MFKLTVIKGEIAGSIVRFKKSVVNVGSGTSNIDLIIDDKGISKIHFTICMEENNFVIKDLNSRSGTYVNNKKVIESKLLSGDVIGLGSYELLFETQNAKSNGLRGLHPKTSNVFNQIESTRSKVLQGNAIQESTYVDQSPDPSFYKKSETDSSSILDVINEDTAIGTNPGSSIPLLQNTSETVIIDPDYFDDLDVKELAINEVISVETNNKDLESLESVSSEWDEENTDVSGVKHGFLPLSAKGGKNLLKKTKQKAGYYVSNSVSTVLDKAEEAGIPRKKASLGIGIILFCVCTIFILLIIGFFSSHGPALLDSSDKVFQIGDEVFEMSLGNGNVDVQCYDKVILSFHYRNGRAILSYSTGGIDTLNEVEIKLNGNKIGYASLAVGKWISNQKISLDRKQLKENSENTIVFDNLKNPPGDENWGITHMKIIQEPLPAPDIEKANQAYKLALKRFESRKVAFNNLFESIIYFRQARDYLELLEPKPLLYAESVDMMKIAKRELDERYDQMMFTARKDLQYGQHERAKNTLQNIMELIPDRSDFRYQEARKNLEQLNLYE